MFNRRMFVALAVCLAVSASSAFAGGNGGTKKNGTVKVQNNTGDTLYAFVNVNANDIQNAVNNNPNNPQGVLNAFNNIGGKQIAAGGTASFSVKNGNQRVTVLDINTQQQVFVDRNVSVNNGGTAKVIVNQNDLPAAG
ncbi:MAG: hypothetical protein ACTHK7_07565 [Aureliella sp.]